MTGGWLFGYVEALRHVGIRSVVVCFSARRKASVRRTHRPTGATICILPAPAPYLRVRRRMRDPYGWSIEDAFGEAEGIRRWGYALLRDAAPYLATPLRRLARALRRERCDAILCQEYEYARFDACVAVGKLLGVPVFATFQGGDWQLSRLEGPLRPLTLKACAGLIVAPQTERERVRAAYGVPARKIARIFNPIDLSNWRAVDRGRARAALGLPETARIAVWHGRVDMHRKGLDVLLDAWQRVRAEGAERDRRLLLVGTGDDAEKMRRRLSEMRPAGVRWVDEYVLDRAAIRRYLSAGDVYVFPSRHEGFPVAPVEAMACGLPVVAAAAPGVPDILEGGAAAGGCVVPRGDAAALASALGPLLDDAARSRTLGARARRRVERRFARAAVGRQLRSFLTRRMAATDGSPPPGSKR